MKSLTILLFCFFGIGYFSKAQTYLITLLSGKSEI